MNSERLGGKGLACRFHVPVNTVMLLSPTPGSTKGGERLRRARAEPAWEGVTSPSRVCAAPPPSADLAATEGVRALVVDFCLPAAAPTAAAAAALLRAETGEKLRSLS